MIRQTAGTLSVVVVEEHELFREGLRTLLKEAGTAVVGEYGSATAALEREVREGKLEPGTVVLCSLTLDGWQELTHHLLLQEPGCLIMGVVDKVTDEVAIESLSDGILCCMDRTVPPEEWVKNIRDAHASKVSPVQTVLHYPAAARHTLMLLSQPPTPTGLHPLAPILGDRERLALGNISEGLPLDMIVKQMGLTEEVVHEVLESACHKLLVRQRLSGILAQLR